MMANHEWLSAWEHGEKRRFPRSVRERKILKRPKVFCAGLGVKKRGTLADRESGAFMLCKKKRGSSCGKGLEGVSVGRKEINKKGEEKKGDSTTSVPYTYRKEVLRREGGK